MKRKKLLLMGSSAFNAMELPAEVRERIDEAMDSKMNIIVGKLMVLVGSSKITSNPKAIEK